MNPDRGADSREGKSHNNRTRERLTGELEGHASSRLPPQPCSWGAEFRCRDQHLPWRVIRRGQAPGRTQEEEAGSLIHLGRGRCRRMGPKGTREASCSCAPFCPLPGTSPMGSLTPTIPIFTWGRTRVSLMSLLPLGDCSVMGLLKLSLRLGGWGVCIAVFWLKIFQRKLPLPDRPLSEIIRRRRKTIKCSYKMLSKLVQLA